MILLFVSEFHVQAFHLGCVGEGLAMHSVATLYLCLVYHLFGMLESWGDTLCFITLGVFSK